MSNFFLIPTSILKVFLYYSIQAAGKTSDADSDCDISNCEYCLSGGHCSECNREFCDSSPCGLGDGDCDPGTCLTGLVCRNSNFLDFHPLFLTVQAEPPNCRSLYLERYILNIIHLWLSYSLAICCKFHASYSLHDAVPIYLS